MICDYRPTSEGLAKCRNCGHTCRRRDVRLRECGEEGPLGLGDNLKRWLTSWGITKERWIDVKTKFGLPPTCGCDDRQDYLNRLGAHFGIATDKYGPHKGENNDSV